MPHQIITYKDRLFRAIGCLIAAHFIVMMGEEISSMQALMTPSYYPTLMINYAIALTVAFAVKKVSIKLDSVHDWYVDIWRRALMQFTFGVAGVSFLSFFLVWIYFASFSQDLHASGYFDYEFPFSISLIVILNFYYVAYYFYVRSRTGREVQPSLLLDGQQASIAQMGHADEEVVKEKREILIVDTPLRSVPVAVCDVAMFFIHEKTLFIRMKEMKSFNDCYSFSMSLADLMVILDEKHFFRINRKCIVNFDVIGSYETYGKNLVIGMKEEIGELESIEVGLWERICTVSSDKVVAFKEWLKR